MQELVVSFAFFPLILVVIAATVLLLKAPKTVRAKTKLKRKDPYSLKIQSPTSAIRSAKKKKRVS